MKRLKSIRIITSSLIAVLLLALNPMGAGAEWRKNNTGWWYAEGSSWSIGWKLINGKYYYFNSTGYMLYDTYVDGYQLGSDGAWIESTPRVSTTANTDTNIKILGPVNLKPHNGLTTNRNLLSCKYDGTSVDLWSQDDSSGRQKWELIRVNGESNVYYIKVVDGINSNRKYLSTNADGTAVDLWSEDDGSGRQKWRVTPVNESILFDVYLIEAYGGVSSNRKFLSCSADGSLVDLWSEDDGSGRQRWIIPNLSRVRYRK